jgi:hypothetical protein
MKNFSLTFFDKNLSILMILAMLYSIPSETQVLHAQADTKSPDQKISEEGLKNIGSAIECMAEAEELLAHRNAVSIRLKNVNK